MMMRRALAGTVLVALAAAGTVLAGGVNGTWKGRFINPQEVGNVPTSAYPVVTVVVRPASITVQGTGKTQAAHDPESATSTCVIRLRFVSKFSSDGWRLYEQFGKPVLSGSVSGGPPAGFTCQYDPSGLPRTVLRVRPAGSKLKAEFGQHFFRLRPPEFGPGGSVGYLHH